MRAWGMIVLAVLVSGCTRAYYRRSADRDVYSATDERNHDPRWAVPRISIDTPPESRLHDPFNPDRPPLPPDDPAAYRYMEWADGHRGSRRWHKNGDAPWIEDPSWYNSLKLSDAGVLMLDPDYAIALGLLHSRDYQTQLENLYLASLALTLNRFEFMAHWFLTNMTSYIHAGSSETESNTLNTNSTFGFTRNFTAGGQFMIDLANNIVFEFAGRDHTSFTSNIAFSLVQPLLRGAGRDVRMEGLTEGERTLLYTLRTFAHFRKNFSFNIITSQYLSLLAQEQLIRNQQQNLATQEQNYLLHEALLANGIVSTVKVDQVFQSVQQSRFNLIQAQASLETQQDSYKNTLGLPPTIPIRLDDSVLAPFQLNEPGLAKLQAEMNMFLAEYRELDAAPSVVKLEEGFQRLKAYYERIGPFESQVGQEIEKWQRKLEEPNQDEQRAARERVALKDRLRDLEEVHIDVMALRQKIERSAAGITEARRKQAWEALQDRVRDLDAAAAQLFVIQTQVRVYLIKLNTVQYEENEAIRYALDNRLDLMNQRAQVVDAWRQITVTASALKAGLDLMVNGNINTPPLWGNPVDFRASASTYTVGVQFDGPLNREAARNAYRTAQINYQQARRSFMLLEDTIARQIRLDLRNLRTNQLSFEIARQTLISAARQVEAAREELVTNPNPDPTSTQNILNALDNVLSSKNALINSWVSYETGRYQLLLDLEALQLDDRGFYRNDHNDPSNPSDTACATTPGP
jgi:outer membrane protein TolC